MTAHAAAPSKDQSKPYALPSGATLHLQRVPFKRADALKKALARALGATPLGPDEMKANFSVLRDNPSAGGALLQRMLQVVASDDVDQCVFAALEGSALYQPKGTVDRLKVDEDLFDHPRYGDEARGDQMSIWLRIGEVAVKPFLGALVSMYKESPKTGASTPASK